MCGGLLVPMYHTVNVCSSICRSCRHYSLPRLCRMNLTHCFVSSHSHSRYSLERSSAEDAELCVVAASTAAPLAGYTSAVREVSEHRGGFLSQGGLAGPAQPLLPPPHISLSAGPSPSEGTPSTVCCLGDVVVDFLPHMLSGGHPLLGHIIPPRCCWITTPPHEHWRVRRLLSLGG